MKRFLIQFAVFLLPIVLASYFVDIFISGTLRRSNSHAQTEYSTWNAIIDGKVNSDIVIYGSSRAWSIIDPKLISDRLHTTAYNLGIDGHNFWLQYLRHVLLLKNNRKPKLIIHSLDIFTLQKNENLYNPDQFLPYMLWNTEIKNATQDYNGFNIIDYTVPLIRYYGKLDAFKAVLKLITKPQANPVERVNGFASKELSWNGEFDRAKKKMKFIEAKVDTPSLHLFEHYLEECQEKNIKVVFVYSPEYIEGQKFIKNRKEIIGLYTKFSEKYKIPFYDFSNDSLSFQKKYFYNASHLNKTGAELFTNKLIDTLKAGKNFN